MAESPSKVDWEQLEQLGVRIMPTIDEYDCECGGRWRFWLGNPTAKPYSYMCPNTRKTYTASGLLGVERVVHIGLESAEKP